MVVQNYALFPHMRVSENVAFGLNARGAAKDLIAQRVEDSLRIVGMSQIRQPLPARTVRRSAAARGDRPRACGPPARPAAGRAAVGARRADSPLDGRGDRQAARRFARPDDPLRDARPERGADARRPHRDPQGRRIERDRPHRRTLSPPAQSLRRRIPGPRQSIAGGRRGGRARGRLRWGAPRRNQSRRGRRERALRRRAPSVRAAAESHADRRRRTLEPHRGGAARDPLAGRTDAPRRSRSASRSCASSRRDCPIRPRAATGSRSSSRLRTRT